MDRYGTLGTSEEREDLARGQCPVCGSRTWIGGPAGGLCVNVACAECGCWWNVCLYQGALVHFEPISPAPEGTRRTDPGPLGQVAIPPTLNVRLVI